MPAMIDKKCASCSKPIRVRLADHKRGWGKYCSKSCKAIGNPRRKKPRFPRHDGRSLMRSKNCQVCGEAAINGVCSPFGKDNGIEWLCENHFDTTHPYDSENFNNE